MKPRKCLGPMTAVLLGAGCAAERPVSTASPSYSDNNQVISSTPAPSYSTTTISSPPPRYNQYAPATQGAAASAQFMTEADRSLADQVRQRCDAALPGSTIAVYNRNGTVTLSGTVPTDQDRAAVVNTVRGTPGVVSVSDQLEVAPGTAPTGRYDQERVYAPNAADFFSLHVRGLSDTDRTLGQRILEGLRTDTVLPTLMPIVNIDVSQGRVFVRGTVQNYEQKRTILAAVQRAAGVNNVTDELQVSPPR